ncbi:hypothetical protein PRIPAC_83834 [Pristionchus pacificus]|uniref:Uncharacterized protein n=1 Tax=Pristionchus pacificus TaxID=54126 RepID=A0A2A6BLQ6_PRIPA|nr:hypothetical protein PRIPAC_83834 [Pristionchus pacificus]|eukprot:PDM66854.1 hypothetical protein PRIPAC_48271 [Pristionchus pacificus]
MIASMRLTCLPITHSPTNAVSNSRPILVTYSVSEETYKEDKTMIYEINTAIHNRSLYGEHAILIQDNAPAHSALQTKEYFARKYIIRVQKQMRKVIEQQGGPVYD